MWDEVALTDQIAKYINYVGSKKKKNRSGELIVWGLPRIDVPVHAVLGAPTRCSVRTAPHRALDCLLCLLRLDTVPSRPLGARLARWRLSACSVHPQPLLDTSGALRK